MTPDAMTQTRDAMNPTVELRFIERDGRKILQQRWGTPRMSRANQYGHASHWLSEPAEWRDVPLVTEPDAGPSPLYLTKELK